MRAENTNSLNKSLPTRQAQDPTVKPIRQPYSLESHKAFLQDWETDFVQRMFEKSKSTRSNWSFRFAKECTSHFEPRDKVLIEYHDFIKTNPLSKNDYFKYCDAYFKGEKLNIKYFRHDKEKLKEYYQKIDKERKKAKEENRKPRPLFSRLAWERYVLFMMLKLNGLYQSEYDELFHVKEKKYREYNPLTSLPSVLRSLLPMKVKEYDIKQANPTFIFKELGIEPFDVYAKIMKDAGISREQAKKEFNMLLNYHKDVKGGYTIDKVRGYLSLIYGDRVDEVITEERFNNPGQMQMDMAKHEKEAIQAFVKANKLKNYVQLHDGLFVLDSTECDIMEIGIVKFGVKQVTPPAVEKNTPVNFYIIKTDEEGYTSVITNPNLYAEFFKQSGFIRLSEENKDDISIIKNENKIVNRWNWETDTVYFLSENINESSVLTSAVKNTIALDTSQIKGGLKLLEGKPLKLHRDTKEAVYIPFANGVARITADEVCMIDYDDKSIGFFMDCEPLKHTFEYSEKSANQSDFKDFLFRAMLGREASEDDLTDNEINILISVCSMIGYLISNYKDPSETYAIIFSDAGADEKSRKGGRGKGVLQTALTKVRPSITKQGDSFKTDYTHKFSDLKKEHDVFIIDDTPASFKYNSFYSEITGGINAERKGTEADQIPLEWTPKFLFSTNFAFRVNKEDSSTTRRFLEYQFTNYWNANHKPKDVYKNSFFNDWDSEQWNSFYSFIVECVQSYLTNGVSQIEYDKARDNYQAYFHNEIIEEEFERIFNLMREREEFTAGDFLKEYQQFNNPLMKEKFFHRNNVKNLIQVYLGQNTDIRIRYVDRSRKWKVEAENVDTIPH